ncbi:hypothetical protein GGR57DRAFT_155277 [Xylariaceae sp. FL1272]|nr:hypothetical protein GGR57DRAFT_155277 [Xylariaceae sp. FL1272]
MIDQDPTEDALDHDAAALVQFDYSGARHLTPPVPGGTLLPGPIASAVSLATRSTSFALRIGTVVSGYGLGAAKVTTLSSLEVGRGILEGILSRAGRDVFAGSCSDMARADAESILERSLESLHRTMSHIVFWTATGFHMTGTTVSAASQISQLFLSVLDQFFGSTDSSRAIASIITLIRREFQNPATGVQGEKVGVTDLLLGLCGLAYLQNWCWRLIQEESRQLGFEEIVWDVVVLNDGERIDTPRDNVSIANRIPHGEPSGTEDLLEAIKRHGARQNSTDDEDDLPETQLKRQITKSLPRDAEVSISTSTTTTKTITVDIKGAPGMLIPSLPGLNLVESEVSPLEDDSSNGSSQNSNYRVVYKVSRNRIRRTSNDNQDDDDDDDAQSFVKELDDEVEPTQPPVIPTIEKSPPIPPKAARPTFASSARDRGGSPPENSTRVRSPGSRSPSTLSDVLSKNLPTDPNEHGANQKRPRKPVGDSNKNPKDLNLQISPSSSKLPVRKPDRPSEATLERNGEKKTGLRSVLRKGSVPTLSNILSRDSSSDNLDGIRAKAGPKAPWTSHKNPSTKSAIPQQRRSVPDRSVTLIPNREPPRAPQRGNPNFFSSRDLGYQEVRGTNSYSKSSYPSPQDHRRSSIVSLTDTFSVQSYESRPSTPTRQSDDTRASNATPTPRIMMNAGSNTPSSQRHQHRPSSATSHYTPSIYTLKTRDSQASLVVSAFHPKSAYSDSDALDVLRRSGGVSGMFPDSHFLRNITRYSRYASAVYGSNFLKLMGISKEQPALNITDETHYDVRSFAHHAKLPPDSILLSSFVDPQGGSDSTGSTDTGIPLVHTVALDEEAKAVVLTCRGTLGFEDVLADMMCEYDDLIWRAKTYQVHKGIHASARRLLYGGDGRVLYTIKEALEEFPDYGLVLCGHSLGGAVTSLLGAMLAEPASSGIGFVTSAEQHQRRLTDGNQRKSSAHVCLPSGRPIHVYAYGPPATMSPSLQKATRGLITSIVHGHDLVPYLSLGVLHDFQALALAFKTDNNEAKAELRRRIWEGLRSGLADKWYNNNVKPSDEEDGKWAYVALKTLRASMMSPKLLPPGEVFTVETTPVMRREAFTQETTGQHLGRPASRIVLRYIRDVETRFREVRFGASMLLDHSPGRYEDALRRLTLGVVT